MLYKVTIIHFLQELIDACTLWVKFLWRSDLVWCSVAKNLHVYYKVRISNTRIYFFITVLSLYGDAPKQFFISNIIIYGVVSFWNVVYESKLH
jgi:hypothetical protein